MKNTLDLIIKARQSLESLTPLNSNCGRLCNAACCNDNGEQEGMLLFPSEENLYTNDDDFVLVSDDIFVRAGISNKIYYKLICNGTCKRHERPLACRIFPLHFNAKSYSIEMDPSAAIMCPLFKHGLIALSQDFINTVCNELRTLNNNKEINEFLENLNNLLLQYKNIF